MFFEIVSIIFGAIIGSFLNVCICRLPKDESIVSPGSHCPQCKNPIRVYDNIPLVSYVLLGGKCRYCRRPISMQYPLVEGVTALASFSMFMKFGPSFQYLYFFAFLCSLIVITVIDLYHQIIPDVISLPGIAVGLLGAFALPQRSFLQAFVGMLLGGGSLFVVATVYQWVLKREGMGGGDVKLLAMIGAFLGWKAVILTIVLSSLIGSVVGILLMVAKGKDFKYAIPFGPFLSLAAVLALFYGESMIRWYVTLGR
jgi:leader peptidase (prepilin peptidase)/N-methyltransferase